MSGMLSDLEIGEIQALQKSYLDLGYDKSLSKPIDVPIGTTQAQFMSADDFTATVEGVKGGKLSVDFTKGKIIVNDGAVDRIIIGILD